MEAPAVLENSKSWKPSEDLIFRIKRFYRIEMNKEIQNQGGVIWPMIGSKQKKIHDALLSDDDAAIRMLSDPGKTNLYYGVDNLAQEIISLILAGDKSGHRHANGLAHGELLRQLIEKLAEAIGQKLVFNPDGGEKFPTKLTPSSLTTEQYLQGISVEIGLNVNFPNPFAGEYGIKTSRGMISIRAIQAIYQAYRMSQVCKFVGGNKCLEIGAGMGRTVYYAHQLGLHCTIIDLPMTIVGQALFLTATLGEDAVWLLGDSAPVGDRIALLPPSECATLDDSFDLVLNADSLTEIRRDVALNYMKFIEENAKIFISINHEANLFSVHELGSLTPKLVPLTRSPYWLRDGYVEELFAIRSNS